MLRRTRALLSAAASLLRILAISSMMSGVEVTVGSDKTVERALCAAADFLSVNFGSLSGVISSASLIGLTLVWKSSYHGGPHLGFCMLAVDSQCNGRCTMSPRFSCSKHCYSQCFYAFSICCYGG